MAPKGCVGFFQGTPIFVFRLRDVVLEGSNKEEPPFVSFFFCGGGGFPSKRQIHVDMNLNKGPDIVDII